MSFSTELDEILYDFANYIKHHQKTGLGGGGRNQPGAKAAIIELVKKEGATGDTSDGYHTFNELYDFRKAYNALLFNEWARQGKYGVHKSYRHSDGELAFGGGWFVVSADTPTGQITNHYENKDWELFDIPAHELADPWDGHTAQEALQRLLNLARVEQGILEKEA